MLPDDEKKYEDVIKKLKNLPRVNAPAAFEADLKRRINAEKTSEKKSFWDKIFIPSRLIPSAGLAAAAIIIFFVVNINSEEMDNPFLIEPKERQDIFEIDNTEEFTVTDEILTQEKPVQSRDVKDKDRAKTSEQIAGREENLMKKEALSDQNLIVEMDARVPETTQIGTTQTAPQPAISGSVEITSDMAITKEELNFRQIQLNEQEQKVVNELRTKMQSNQQKKADYQK
jgi:hypothetical protein